MVILEVSAKFTLNSKRFPRLKSTFPLWLNLQSSPRYIQNGFQPSSHFFLDRKPFELVLCLLLGWTFLNYLCRRCSNALGSRGLGMLKKLSGPKKFFPVSEMPLLQADLQGLDSSQIRPQRREAAAAVPRYPATPQALAILESSRATWERWIRTIDQNFRVP